MQFSEVISQALKSLGGNRLRTILTLLIINLGITALIGILTLLEGINGSVTEGFGAIGAQTFDIQSNENFGSRRNGKRVVNPSISYNEAMNLKSSMLSEKVKISISAQASSNTVVKYAKQTTDPNIRVEGIDDQYATANVLEVEFGRLLSESEIQNGTQVAVIGPDLADILFNSRSNAIGKIINMGNMNVQIIGVTKAQGSGFDSNEKVIYISIVRARNSYKIDNFSIKGIVPDANKMEEYISATTGIFRNIRGLSTKEETNFILKTKEAELEEFQSVYSNVVLLGSVIGAITLLGASVALMNILLVSVNERTREIGVAKALGAKSYNIRMQFLTEAIILCQMGGVSGIIFGIGIGNIIAQYMDLDFILPIKWIILGVSVCLVVGVGAGWYPAYRASKLDPIEALRFE